MKKTKRLAAFPLTAMVALGVHAQQAPAPEDRAAAARANAEQDRQAQQQRDAQQQDATVRAPAVRSDVPRAEAYPSLPSEQPCFRIDNFVLEVPDSLPASSKASAYTQRRPSFKRSKQTV